MTDEWHDFIAGKEWKCWSCGYVSNAVTWTHSDAPKPGDVGLCVECGEYEIIDKSGEHRKPTDDEYVEIGLSPECRRVRRAWLAAKREWSDGKGKKPHQAPH